MSQGWVSREAFLSKCADHAREMQKMRDIVLELTAVVDQVNTKGWWDRLLQRVYLNTSITPEKVAELRAKKAAKAAAYRAREGA